MRLHVLLFALSAGPVAGLALAAGLPRGAACAARASPPRCQMDAGDKGPMKMAVSDCDADDIAVVPKGRFIAWVKSEQELKEWKKANPIDPVQTLKGPLTSVAILTAGFYTIVRRSSLARPVLRHPLTRCSAHLSAPLPRSHSFVASPRACAVATWRGRCCKSSPTRRVRQSTQPRPSLRLWTRSTAVWCAASWMPSARRFTRGLAHEPSRSSTLLRSADWPRGTPPALQARAIATAQRADLHSRVPAYGV